ncbi:large-conductance mechanosensitive channel protein MscL [Robiginitalea sp. SC105]|uniref:large-conductance mechanosensitive channel protein MscL n=1 Tax=Robiginitalea sp. SC105 TaxID=2762332 RepID=UPI001639F2CD|nr:large-conductance mechanosensitive channel protein MscL [Robiginitalea sp. SC105]MBC2840633.1 large-conductance mechanosensitive channel protein MscL [Robiginitalea sp. SC105]
MRGFIREFKDFAIRGNMFDMAIGIIIGTAFNNVVNALVKQILTPPLALFTSGVNFSNLRWVLREATENSEEISMGYGMLLETLIDFGIIALTIFLFIKGLNRIRNRADDPNDKAEVTPKEIELLARIEALMQEQNQWLKNKKE